MKTSVQTVATNRVYPYLAVSSQGTVVKFVDHNRGTVVISSDGDVSNHGAYSGYDEDCYRPMVSGEAIVIKG